MGEQLYTSAKKHIKQYTENLRAFTQMSQHLQVQSAKRDAQTALQAMRRPSVEVVEQRLRPQLAYHDFRRIIPVGKTHFGKSLAGEPCRLEVNRANGPRSNRTCVTSAQPFIKPLCSTKLLLARLPCHEKHVLLHGLGVWMHVHCYLQPLGARHSEEDANWLRGNWVCGTNSFFRVAVAWMAIFWETTAVNVAQRRQELRVLCEWDLTGIWPEMAWFGKPGCGACT